METLFAVRAWRGNIILTAHSRAALGTSGLSLSGRRTKLYQQNVAFFIFPYWVIGQYGKINGKRFLLCAPGEAA
jgi:hypothetical protein